MGKGWTNSTKLVTTLNNMEDNADIKEYADQINKVFLQSDVNEGLKKRKFNIELQFSGR